MLEWYSATNKERNLISKVAQHVMILVTKTDNVNMIPELFHASVSGNQFLPVIL